LQEPRSSRRVTQAVNASQDPLGLRAEFALGALRAEHRQPVVDAGIGAPRIGGVLVLARLPAALGNMRKGGGLGQFSGMTPERVSVLRRYAGDFRASSGLQITSHRWPSGSRK
jgi:hypothetical protein